MIDIYAWGTPNGFKPLIMLEETGLPYRLRKIDLRASEQKSAEYLAINPNGKIPAMVDHDAAGEPLVLFESGAILIYLAEKSGQFLAADVKQRFQTLQWVMFQISGIGPAFGQLGAFSRMDPPNPAGVDRFRRECERLLAVLEGQLAKQPWLAGDYSIADMSMFTWIRAVGLIGLDLETAPSVAKWRDRIEARPAVKQALAQFDPP